MKRAEEERLLADLFTQLGGSKTKRDDWITIAKKCKRLRDYYGSTEELAEKLQRSYQLVRSILTLLTLPEEVQQLLKERKIGYDAAQKLYKLRDKPDKQIEVARTMAQLTSHKSREVIHYAKSYPDSSLLGFAERVKDKPASREKIHVAIVPLKDDTYFSLDRISKKEKIPIPRLILNIIDEWTEKWSAH
jgi:ParB-like chromosome segregation protein Spo0J